MKLLIHSTDLRSFSTQHQNNNEANDKPLRIDKSVPILEKQCVLCFGLHALYCFEPMGSCFILA